MTRLIAAVAALALLLSAPGFVGPARAQSPAAAQPAGAQIEGELNLITPISKFPPQKIERIVMEER